MKKENQTKICEICNILSDDIEKHYKVFHQTNKKDKIDIKNIKPKKEDSNFLNEKLYNDNSEEFGIDEKKKKILLRQFKPNLHAKEINIKNLNYLTEKKKPPKSFIENRKNIKSPDNNFQSKKKEYPEDTNRNDFITRTVKRNNERKLMEIKKDDYIRSDDRKNKNRRLIIYYNYPNSKIGDNIND